MPPVPIKILLLDSPELLHPVVSGKEMRGFKLLVWSQMGLGQVGLGQVHACLCGADDPCSGLGRIISGSLGPVSWTED